MRSSLLVLCLCTGAFAFGPTGHKAVVYIAEQNMSARTLEKVNKILYPETMEGCCMWADSQKARAPATAPWHYVALPLDSPVTDSTIEIFYPYKKTNIVRQIKNKIDVLETLKSTAKDRKDALKYLIHLMGDLHQPLHCISNGDDGGNKDRVIFFPPDIMGDRTRTMNLHALWDNLIEYKTMEFPEYLGGILNGRIRYDQKMQWQQGTVEMWAFESYRLAKDSIYTVQQADDTLPMMYYTNMRPIVEECLQKAGIRLASILEDIFGK